MSTTFNLKAPGTGVILEKNIFSGEAMKDVCIIIGSESDREQIDPGIKLLAEKKISHECHTYSAHRNLDELLVFLKEREKDFRVIIACAGLAAALPGLVA